MSSDCNGRLAGRRREEESSKASLKALVAILKFEDQTSEEKRTAIAVKINLCNERIDFLGGTRTRVKFTKLGVEEGSCIEGVPKLKVSETWSAT